MSYHISSLNFHTTHVMKSNNSLPILLFSYSCTFLLRFASCYFFLFQSKSKHNVYTFIIIILFLLHMHFDLMTFLFSFQMNNATVYGFFVLRYLLSFHFNLIYHFFFPSTKKAMQLFNKKMKMFNFC